MKQKFLILILSFFTVAVNAQLVINEYSASNNSIIADYQGDFEDYVEIYNGSAAPVNLFNYYLSDEATNINKWVINQAVNVPANGRIVLFCSGKDLITPGGQIHTKFKLTQCKNEKIILADAAGTIVDSLTMLRTQNNHSRGRLTDGANSWGLFTTPNPNMANANSQNGYADRPLFSVNPGFYAGAQSIILSNPDPTVTIRYTTNGTTPNATSTIYTGPIAVNTTTVIRAVSFSSTVGIAPSFTETNTYFINVTHTMPVISLCGPYNNLFPGGQETRTTFEFFDSLKNFKWEFEGYSRRHGHDSWAFPQKGFRVYAEDKYGYLHQMDEKFFGTSTREEFPMIILKAGASDNYPANGGGRSYAHMRDAFTQTYSIKNNLDLDERSYCPTIVYINGQYWGVYEIRERVDEDFTEYYYNQNGSDIDLLRMWGGLNVQNGTSAGWASLYNFITNNNMAVAANYNFVDSQLNFKSLIDYMVINTVGVNSDWLNWNTMWWRGNKGAGVKWRYSLWDMDNTWGLGENYTGLPTTSANADPCATFDLSNQLSGAFQGHVDITNSLMANPKFKAEFQNRYAYLMTEVFTCDSMVAHLERFRSLLKPEMTGHVARWGGSVATWEKNVDSVKRFILRRCSLIGSDADTCLKLKNLTINVDPLIGGTVKIDNTLIPYYPKKYALNADSLINFVAIPAPGYEFVEWKNFEVTNTITPSNLEDTIDFKIVKVDSLVAIFRIDLPDTFNIVINALPGYAGSVDYNGQMINTFPTVVKAVENNTYTVKAIPGANHQFKKWMHYNTFDNSIAPNDTVKNITYNFVKNMDTIEAIFDTLITVTREVFIPNAFSPNNSVPNNFFGVNKITNSYFMSSAVLKVYDRYGSVVYNGNGINEIDALGNVIKHGWDGKKDGIEMNQDTYYYIMQVYYTDNTSKEFKGDVTLIR
jgi:gliding motility-associated-like protein